MAKLAVLAFGSALALYVALQAAAFILGRFAAVTAQLQ